MIAIVIVGYNSRHDLKDCLSSIFKNTFSDFKVIFVDNDSTDHSADYVKNNFSKVLILKNSNNGYAGGNNLGIKKAIELKADSVLLLNPDTIIAKDCLQNLMSKSEHDTILQPLILLSSKGKKTELINTTGNYLNFLGFSYCNNYLEPKSSAKESEIILSSGAAALIPIEILKKIGRFSEDFFMYHEDVDLFYRARLNGYKILLIPNALVWHKYSFSKNKKKMFYTERNRLLFLYRNFSLKYLLLILPISIVNEILIILYSILGGWFILKIKTYASFIGLIAKSSKQRKINLANIKMRERILKKSIGPIISFSEVSNSLFAPYNALLWIYYKVIYIFI